MVYLMHCLFMNGQKLVSAGLLLPDLVKAFPDASYILFKLKETFIFDLAVIGAYKLNSRLYRYFAELLKQRGIRVILVKSCNAGFLSRHL